MEELQRRQESVANLLLRAKGAQYNELYAEYMRLDAEIEKYKNANSSSSFLQQVNQVSSMNPYYPSYSQPGQMAPPNFGSTASNPYSFSPYSISSQTPSLSANLYSPYSPYAPSSQPSSSVPTIAPSYSTTPSWSTTPAAYPSPSTTATTTTPTATGYSMYPTSSSSNLTPSIAPPYSHGATPSPAISAAAAASAYNSLPSYAPTNVGYSGSGTTSPSLSGLMTPQQLQQQFQQMQQQLSSLQQKGATPTTAATPPTANSSNTGAIGGATAPSPTPTPTATAAATPVALPLASAPTVNASVSPFNSAGSLPSISAVQQHLQHLNQQHQQIAHQIQQQQPPKPLPLPLPSANPRESLPPVPTHQHPQQPQHPQHSQQPQQHPPQSNSPQPARIPQEKKAPIQQPQPPIPIQQPQHQQPPIPIQQPQPTYPTSATGSHAPVAPLPKPPGSHTPPAAAATRSGSPSPSSHPSPATVPLPIPPGVDQSQMERAMMIQGRLTQLQNQLVQREQKVKEREAKLLEQEARIQSLQLQLESRDRELKRNEEKFEMFKQQNAEQIQARRGEWEKRLEEKEKALDMREQLLQQRESSIKSREVKAKQKEEELRNFYVWSGEIPDEPEAPPPPPPDEMGEIGSEGVGDDNGEEEEDEDDDARELPVIPMVDPSIEINRQKAITEVITSEIIYVGSLGHVIQKYLEPLRAEGANVVKRTELAEIFCNIENLFQINAELSSQLQKIHSGESRENIAEVFIKMAPMLHTYTDYYQNFENSNKVRTALSKNSTFRNLLKKLQDASGVPHMDLDSYLIMPIQRLPRYRLLLEAVIRFTPEDHPERQIYETARNLVASVVTAINERKRDEDNKNQVVAISKKINGISDLVTPTRRFIKEGVLQELPRDLNPSGKKEVQCFLFNDLLLVTRKSRVRKVFHFVDRMELSQVYNLRDQPDDPLFFNRFSISTMNQTKDFVAESNDLKYVWLDALQEALKPFKRG